MSVARSRRISALILGRVARNLMSRASSGSVALVSLWPGRTDRLIIAPHDLRTADATLATEIYSGRFAFAGKVVVSVYPAPRSAAWYPATWWCWSATWPQHCHRMSGEG